MSFVYYLYLHSLLLSRSDDCYRVYMQKRHRKIDKTAKIIVIIFLYNFDYYYYFVDTSYWILGTILVLRMYSTA